MVPQKFCELHVHIEGCVWNEHISNWWRKSKYLFPPISYFNMNKKTSFELFLEQLRFGYNFLNDLDAYKNVFNFYIDNAVNQNIVYAEVQINLALINTWGINLVQLLEEVNEINNNKIELRFIIDIPWQFSPTILNNIFNASELYRKLGVVGIGLGGDERLAKPNKFKELRKKANESNLKILCHVGETTSFEFSKKIIEEINPDRIAHGLSLIDDIILNSDKYPPLDICISSNLKLNLVDSIESHPLRKIISSNVVYSLSTDDPAIFKTTLRKEYELASLVEGFSESVLNIESFWEKAAFDKEGIKRCTTPNKGYKQCGKKCLK